MDIRELTLEEVKKLYEEELPATFPAAELKPYEAVEALKERDCYLPLGLFENGALVSYLMLWTDRTQQYALIDYLAAVRGCRNSGYGARMLRETFAAYPQFRCFLGEVEAPDDRDEAENALRRRRLAFYERNGFRFLNYDCALFGVHYRDIVFGDVTDGEALLAHQNIYAEHFPPTHLKRFIQLPLEPGEAVKPCFPWTEADGI